ncbi:TPA: hypothetical protein ACP32N_005071 [Pseudomonas aeruginosa]
MNIKPNPSDCPYHAPREWLHDEGYSYAELQTPAQMRKAAAEVLELGREMVDVAEDALAEIERVERMTAPA